MIFNYPVSAIDDNDTNYNLNIERDTILNQTKLFINKDDVQDTIIIYAVSHSFDSITQIDNLTWSYIYTLMPGKIDRGMTTYNQVVIRLINKALKIVYYSNYLYADRNIDSMGFFLSSKVVPFLSDTVERPFVEYKNVEYEIYDALINRDSLKAIFYLHYDQNQKVYYNVMDTLNGIYYVKPIKSDGKSEALRKVFINHEVVPALKSKRFYYIYYRKYWFHVEGNRLISLQPLENQK